jgi:hypothetical protein
MPQIWLRPFMARNVVEKGRRVKVNPRLLAQSLRKKSARTVETKRFRRQPALPRATESGRGKFLVSATVNETFTPPSHS